MTNASSMTWPTASLLDPSELCWRLSCVTPLSGISQTGVTLSLQQALEDFRDRIAKYEEVYETITDRNMHYIKLIDMCACWHVDHPTPLSHGLSRSCAEAPQAIDRGNVVLIVCKNIAHRM